MPYEYTVYVYTQHTYVFFYLENTGKKKLYISWSAWFIL